MQNEDSLIHTVVVGVVRDEARRGDRIAKLLRKLQFSGWSVMQQQGWCVGKSQPQY